MKEALDLRGINFEDGYIAVVDKPLRWTSTDVVRKIKFALRRLGYRKSRSDTPGRSTRWPRASCWSASAAPPNSSTPCKPRRRSMWPT